MASLDYGVLNALNLINKNLGEAYETRGFNPFVDNFVLDKRLAEKLVATGKCTLAFDKPFMNEFAVKTAVPAKDIQEALLAAGILGGVRIADDMLLICVTEQRTKAEIDKFVEVVNNI